MNQPLNTWNYSYCLPAGELTTIVRSFVRGMFSGLAGSYKEGSQVVVTFFAPPPLRPCRPRATEGSQQALLGPGQAGAHQATA